MRALGKHLVSNRISHNKIKKKVPMINVGNLGMFKTPPSRQIN